MRRAISMTLSGLKYLIAAYFMYAGITTALSPLDDTENPAGFIYAHRASIVLLGSWFFLSGFTLTYAKIYKHRRWVGYALLSMYMSFLFASILNGFSNHWQTSAWLPNLLASFVIGALFLRWKYHILYVPSPSDEQRQEILHNYLKD